MHAPTTLDHPAPIDLTRFALGQLDDDDRIAQHLDACPACQQHVAGVPADGFVSLLRSARLADDTQIEANALTLEAEPLPNGGELTTPFTHRPTGDLPSELLDHPRYRPIRLLGQGGMGTVWLAEHRLMGRQVAVKIIHPEFLRKPGALPRFRQEVLAASRLHHPNIVTAFEAEDAGSTHLLATEYVEGVTLADELRRLGRLGISNACDAIRQAAVGLAHAAERGLVHRDLKPHNLMRTPDGVVKILDFGLATLTNPQPGDGGLTGANIVLGTPDYIAPEQAEGSRNADVRSDVYSLGCTLYHLLTGQVPYPGESVLKKLDGHRGGEPTPLTRLRPEVPRELAGVVAKMMEKDPQRRYQTPTEVAVALEYVNRPAQPKPPRWGMLVASLMVAAVLAVAGIVIRLQTGEGEVVITPLTDDVEISLRQGGKEVRILDTKSNTSVMVPVGSYDVAMKGEKKDFELKTDRVTVQRGGRALVTIERKAKVVQTPPPTSPDRRVTNPAIEPVAPLAEVWQLKTELPGALAVTLLPNLDVVAVGDYYSAVLLVDLNTGKLKARLQGHVGPVWSQAVSSDSKHLAAADIEGRIHIWELSTGKLLRQLDGVHAPANTLAFSPDGRWVASSGITLGWTLWDLQATGARTHTFKEHSTTGVAFSPDGKRVLTGGEDGHLRLWDLEAGKVVATYPKPGGADKPARIWRVAFSPDGKLAFSATGNANTEENAHDAGDCSVRVWDIVAEKELRRFGGFRLAVTSLAVSQTGQRLLAGSADGKVKVWDVNEGREIAGLTLASGIRSVSISPNGMMGLVCDRDGIVRMLRLPRRGGGWGEGFWSLRADGWELTAAS